MARSRYRRAAHRAPARPPLSELLLHYAAYLCAFAVCAVTLYLALPMAWSQWQAAGAPGTQATAPAGNVGGQAPPAVRGSNPDPIARPAAATPIVGIAQSEAESQAMYQATAQAANGVSAPAAVPTAAPAPLPLNSMGAPIIDAQQQAQLDQSAQMAADEQQAALRAQQLADAQSRAPDVSKEDAEQMMHRDLCHVPRADPATCGQGLFKPTPIGGK